MKSTKHITIYEAFYISHILHTYKSQVFSLEKFCIKVQSKHFIHHSNRKDRTKLSGEAKVASSEGRGRKGKTTEIQTKSRMKVKHSQIINNLYTVLNFDTIFDIKIPVQIQ
jgi:hypothetical protein